MIYWKPLIILKEIKKANTHFARLGEKPIMILNFRENF